MLKQQANNKEKVALYSRLSRDDGLDKESNSIANQREMLKRYAKENKFYVYDEYIGLMSISWTQKIELY